MDKQREEFEECDAVFWDSRPFWKAKYFSCDAMIDPTHMIQARTEFRLGWQAAQTARQPEINFWRTAQAETSDVLKETEQQLSAANQRIAELLDLVEVVERRNKQLEERIRVADAEEPVGESTSGGEARIYRGIPLPRLGSKLYLHAQIPAEVELKKLAEMYLARRKHAYKTRIQAQMGIGNMRQTEEEFNAEYDAAL